MRNILTILSLLCIINSIHNEAYSKDTIDKSYLKYDFNSGESILFEDNFKYPKGHTFLENWSLKEGKASLTEQENVKALKIDTYYTKLSPNLFNKKKLPENFSIQYDTWLDHGYDGNPGIEIHLLNGDKEVCITPNKHDLSVSFPNDGRTSKENPSEYFGENKFYDRWIHISISYFKKQLKVYLDQYKLIDIPDCRIKPNEILVTGNSSNGMKILMKNFRVSTGFISKIKFDNGKFITRAINFDVDKAILKPESITIIKQIKEYLDSNPNIKLLIGGHTDSDGDDNYNLKLSKERAESVKNQLVEMGILSSRLEAKGFGESSPLDTQKTSLAKALNRRVEFTIIK